MYKNKTTKVYIKFLSVLHCMDVTWLKVTPSSFKITVIIIDRYIHSCMFTTKYNKRIDNDPRKMNHFLNMNEYNCVRNVGKHG